MLAITFKDPGLEGDLSYEGGCLVDSGFDLETAVALSLFCDAPAQNSDPVSEDTPRRGWWADVYDEDGIVLGSRLWLLEQSEATEATASTAAGYANDALKWLVDDGHVRSFVTRGYVEGEAILLTINITLKSGREVVLGPFEV